MYMEKIVIMGMMKKMKKMIDTYILEISFQICFMNKGFSTGKSPAMVPWPVDNLSLPLSFTQKQP